MERAEQARFVFYSLSGGRDSQAALELTIDAMRASGKHIELLYVDNHSELESVRAHAEATAERAGLPLTILDGVSFEEHYERLGRWPNPIHKDCIETLINRPIDAHCRLVAGGEDYILVRGGRPSQRGRYSTSAAYQELKGKPGMIIYKPLYLFPDYETKWPVWPGYGLGYARTRCWCCPFALISDWELMRKLEPERFERLKGMFGRLTWRAYKGDGYLRRIEKYWVEEQGVQVPMKRTRQVVTDDEQEAEAGPAVPAG